MNTLLRVKPLFLLFFLILQAMESAGQRLDPNKELSQYNIDYWTNDDFPSGGVLQMIQTHDGYLWMATFNGLLRFDGVDFVKFDKYNVKAFTDSGFRSLYEDHNNNFWAGGVGGGLYLKTDRDFVKFEIPFGTSSNNIRKIFHDSQDRLWLGTTRGLVLYQDSVFKLIQPPGISSDVDFAVQDIEEDDEGRLWVAAGQWIYRYEDGEMKMFKPEQKEAIGEIRDLLIMDDVVWMISYENGVYQLVDESDEIQKFMPLNSVIKPLALFRDAVSNLWIATEVGIVRYNGQDVSTLTSEEGLSDEHINTMLEDHEGSVWLGTYYGGLNRLRDGAFINYTKLNNLSDNTIHCVLQTFDGIIWVGTESGLNYYDGNQEFKTADVYDLQSSRIRDLYEDSNSNLWVSTYSGLFKKSGNKFVKYTTRDGLISNQVRTVIEDHKGRIWVGTRNGISLLDRSGWKTYSIKDGLINDFILSFHMLRDDRMLISTTGGLQVMENDTISLYQIEGEPIRYTVFRMFTDSEGITWAGSVNGLICFNDDFLYSFNLDHYMLGANIYEVIQDRNGYFWLTSDMGIIRISRKALVDKMKGRLSELSPTLFDRSNGLRTNNTTSVSNAAQTQNGDIWFATLEGVSILNPDSIQINEVPPPIVIDRVLIDGIEQHVGEVVVPPQSKNIEIQYAGLSYMVPKKVAFKYMLEGYEEDWNNVGDRRTAYYTSLPPGRYRFKVAACNNDGVWNFKSTELEFVVEKPFWQTPMFYVMMVLILAILAIGFMDFKSRRTKSLNRLLEDKILDRTKEVLLQKEEIEAQRDHIESKNNELEKARNLIAKQYEDLREVNENLEEKVNSRTRELQKAYTNLIRANRDLDDFVYKSAHDIKGPLARLRGLCNLALMETSEPVAIDYIKRLQRESMFANLILEKLSRAQELKSLKPSVSKVFIHDIICEITESLRRHDEGTPILIHNDIDRGITIETDKKFFRELLFNVIENSMVFKATENPEVFIRIEDLNSDVRIIVEDNGIKIAPEVQKEIFKIFVKGSERSKGIGLGLFIADKAAKILGGSIELEKSDEKGNVFSIVIPKIYAVQPDEKLTLL